MIIFLSYFSSKPYVVFPHLNLQMRGHNICFYAESTKITLIITKHSLLSRALEHIQSSLDISNTGISKYPLM